MFILTETKTGNLIGRFDKLNDAYTAAMETPDSSLFTTDKRFWRQDGIEAIVLRFDGTKSRKIEHWIVPIDQLKSEIYRRHMGKAEHQEVMNGREADTAAMFKVMRDGLPAVRTNADFLREKREQKYKDAKKGLEGYGINLDHVAP